MDIFWNYTIQEKSNFPAQKVVQCLLFLMIVDKFAKHTCISQQTLRVMITTQFSHVYNRLQEIAFHVVWTIFF